MAQRYDEDTVLPELHDESKNDYIVAANITIENDVDIAGSIKVVPDATLKVRGSWLNGVLLCFGTVEVHGTANFTSPPMFGGNGIVHVFNIEDSADVDKSLSPGGTD